MKSRSLALSMATPGIYQITIQGVLDPSWSQRLSGMEIITLRSSEEDVLVSILTGELMDQADLMGVLNFLYDMGYPLLSVKRLEYVAMER